MVIRHDGLLRRNGMRHSQSGRSVKDSCVIRVRVVLFLAQHGSPNLHVFIPFGDRTPVSAEALTGVETHLL